MGLGSDRLLIAPEFFKRGARKVTFNVPAGFADPHVIPAYDAREADPEVIAAIAAVRSVRPVPIIDADEPSVLLTQRTAHLNDHAGQILFPGGRIDAIEENPTAAALSEGRGWLGKSLLLIEVKRPGEYSSGFEKMMQWRANAVAVIENPIFFANREKITSSAANSKLQHL